MINDHSCSFLRGMNWHTYNYLEKRTLETSRYVTFDLSNSQVWSEAFADLLMLTGSAIDSFFREMKSCPDVAEKNEVKVISDRKGNGKWDIIDFRDAYEPIYELSENKVDVPFGLSQFGSRTPFDRFVKGKATSKRQNVEWVPDWWTAYNKLKHEYYMNIHRCATLVNVIDALSALLILNVLHKDSQRYLINQKILKTALQEDFINDILKKSFIGLPKTAPVHNIGVSTTIFSFNLREDDSI